MKMPTTYSYRDIWRIAYPILISLLMEQLIGMTDTAFLGRVGEVELGASALASIYYMAIFMLAFGFGVGANILIGRRNGEGNYRSIGSIFYQGLFFLLLLACAMFFLSRHLSGRILSRLIESPAVLEATLSYMDWRVYGFFFSFAAIMFRSFFIGTTHTKTLTLNSVVMVLSNVFFNYVLIFGKLGCPALGIAGAAIGSSLSELVSLLFFTIYTLRRVDLRKYGLNRVEGFRLATLRQILNISTWTMIQNFIAISIWFLFFLAIEHLGERPLAITNLIRNVSALPFMTISAFASTCSTLASNLIGAGRSRFVGGTILQCIRMAALFVVPLVVFFAAFPGLILRIYTDSPQLIEESIPSLWVLCSSYVLSIPAYILFQTVSGTGNTRTALVMDFVALFIYTAYILFTIIHLRLDVALCWTSEHVYSLCILSLSYYYLRHGHWRDKRI